MRPNGHDPERARRALWSLDAGAERDDWVRAAMAAKAAGLTFEDFDQWSATAGNYAGQADCAAVWRSIKEDGGIQAGTLYAMAKSSGWQEHNGPQQRPHQTRQKPAQAPQRPEQGKRPPFDVQAAWEAGEPATAAQPYIIKKEGDPAGLKVYRGPERIAGQALDGALMVPAFDMAGKLKTVQFIPTEGKKLNAPGRPVAGAFVVGRITQPGTGQTIAICEGIGQAWSCNQATGCAAVVSFGSGRMQHIAQSFRTRYPAARLVLVADAGKEIHCARIAKEIGCTWVEMPADSPQNFDANDLHQRDGLDALASLLRNPKAPPQRFRLMTAEELAALPPVRWRVRGVLPQEGIAAIYGPPGSGKSFLAIDMLAAIATGRPWFNYRVQSAPVLYVALEGEHGIAQRVQAHQSRHGTAERVRFLAAPLDLRKAEDRADLAREAKAAGLAGGVVCIDTLAASAPGMDENTSSDMGEMIAALKALQAELGGLVLVVHHAGKDATKGLRGHSSLHGALDAAIEVQRNGDRREWQTSKSKDGEDGKSHPFRLDIIELGIGDDGEAITSCVIAPEERQADGIRRAALPGGGNQRLAYDAISAALKDARTFGQASAPPGRPCIELEAAITAAASRLPCDPKRRRERAQSAITTLVSKGNLQHQEGWVWVP